MSKVTSKAVAIRETQPTDLISYLQVTNYPAVNGENETLREALALILDNWRLVSAMQLMIATTLNSYYRPAERMTRKQRYHIATALSLLNALDTFRDPSMGTL